MTTLTASDFLWQRVGDVGWKKAAYVGDSLFSQKIEATVTLVGGEPMARVSGRGETKFLLSAVTVKAAKAWASREFNLRIAKAL